MRRGRGSARALGGLAGLATVGLMVSSCGGSDNGGSDLFSVAIAEPQYMTPSNCNETSCAEALDGLYLGLVSYDPDTNEAQLTALADSIESDDNTTWTIRLNEGFTFHDGTPVTADSFIKAWNYAAYGPNAQNNSYFFGPDALGIQGYDAVNPADPDPEDDQVPEPTADTLAGLEKVSDTEFTVTLDNPFSQFTSVLGYTTFYPMPDAAFNADGTLVDGFEEEPIGNGPYQMDGSWEHNVQIRTVTYPDFAGDAPKNGGVTYKIYQTLEAQWADLQADEVDVTDSLPPSALATAESVLGDRYINQPSSAFQFLGFPTTDPAYADIKVRQAISRAINREEITQTIFEGTRSPSTAFVSPVVAGYRDGTCGDSCSYDQAAAKQLWDEAANKPDTITITYNNDGGHKPWVDAACNQIAAALGVECNGVPKADFATLLDDLDAVQTNASANFGPFRLGWVMDYPSMQNYLGPLYSTNGSSNYYGYSSQEFDQLIVDGNQSDSADAAIEQYQAAEDVLAQDFPVIPLWDANLTGGYSTKVSDVSIDAFERVDKVNVVVNS